MKDLKWLGMVASACLFLNACEKDSRQNAQLVQHKIVASATTEGFVPAGYTFEDMVQGVDDADTRIRKIKLHLSVGLKEICADPNVAQWIAGEALRAEEGSVKFTDLFAKFPAAKAKIEAAVDPLQKLTGSSYQQLEDGLDYMGFQYWPCIHVANEAVADAAQLPLVSPGLEMDDDVANGRSDIITAWKLDATETPAQVLLWEELANTTSSPVLVVSLWTRNKVPAPGIPVETPATGTSDVIDARMRIFKYQIGAHYDRSKYNEYCVTGWWVSNTSDGPFLRYGCSTGYVSGFEQNHYTKIGDVHKDNLWKHMSTDKFFCLVRHTAESDPNKRVFFNTYERDWFANRKALGEVQWGHYKKLWGNMEYAHEWYQFDPYLATFWQNRVQVPAVSSGYQYYFWGTNPGSGQKGYTALEITSPCY